jgi:glutaminyl-peptide cyclotransferase
MSLRTPKRGTLLVFLALAMVMGGCTTQTGPDVIVEEATTEKRSFDGQRAYQYALDQCAIGPRPPGTEAGWATGDYIIDQLHELGWEVVTEEFEYKGVQLRNVIGKRGQGPVVILGAHYDTRPVADRDPDPTNVSEPIIGGNDGASGVAVLLELADVLCQYELENEVWLAFFDGEDSGHLNGWPFCVGSAYMAEHLSVEPAWVIVLDMVGDADQQLYYEGNSDRALRERLWDIAGGLAYETFVPEVRYSMFDDHVPFLNEGIPAVDIIDFDYPYWHTIEDTCDKLSAESLARIGRVLEALLVREG